MRVDSVRPRTWPYEECEPAYGSARQRASEHAIACAGKRIGRACEMLHLHLGRSAVAARRRAERDGGGEYCCGQRHSWALVIDSVNAGPVIGAYDGRG